MIIDLDEIFEDRLEHLLRLNEKLFSELGRIVPIAIILSVSDGEDPKFEGAPEGDVVDFTVLLDDLMGGDLQAMIVELMRGLQYRAGGGDVLEEKVSDAVGFLIQTHPTGPDEARQDMLRLLLDESGVHQKEILIMALQRLIRSLDGIGIILSLDSYYKRVEGAEEDLDLSKVDLQNDSQATDAHTLHMYAPAYNRVITKPYHVEDGALVFDESDIMDSSKVLGTKTVVRSRFSRLFEQVEAN